MKNSLILSVVAISAWACANGGGAASEGLSASGNANTNSGASTSSNSGNATSGGGGNNNSTGIGGHAGTGGGVVTTSAGAGGMSTSAGAGGSSSGAGPVANGKGENCGDLADLVTLSQVGGSKDFAYTLSDTYGATDDYNPYTPSGKKPGCSPVYDAVGYERVYALKLNPGDIFKARLVAMPNSSAAAIYVLDDCQSLTWPDYDQSTMCGSNEYKSQGFCGPTGCYPMDFAFEYPKELNQKPTKTKTFYIVVDQVGGNDAASFVLEWQVE